MPRPEGKAAFREGSAGLCPIMRGADVHRQWEEGDELCSIYDFKIETPAGYLLTVPRKTRQEAADG